jgi:hypothetical protein
MVRDIWFSTVDLGSPCAVRADETFELERAIWKQAEKLFDSPP